MLEVQEIRDHKMKWKKGGVYRDNAIAVNQGQNLAIYIIDLL